MNKYRVIFLIIIASLLSSGTANAQEPEIEIPFGLYCLSQKHKHPISHCNKVAAALYNGNKGLKRDVDKAITLLKATVDVGISVGDYTACDYLAQIFNNEERYEEALKYIRILADINDNKFVYQLAVYYADGLGVAQDNAMAHELLDRLINNEEIQEEDKALYYVTKGIMYLREDDRETAKAMLDKSLIKNSTAENTGLYREFYGDKPYASILAEAKAAEEARLVAEAKTAEEKAAIAKAEEEAKAAEEKAAIAKAEEEARLAAQTKAAEEKAAKEAAKRAEKEAKKAAKEAKKIAAETTKMEDTVSFATGENTIIRKGSQLYDAATGKVLTASDFANPSLWQEYEKGSKLMKTGNILYIAGGASLVGLFGLGILDANVTYITKKPGNIWIAGFIIGPACAITGMVMRLSGKSTLNHIVQTSNGQVLGTLSVGPQPNGFGLAYIF